MMKGFRQGCLAWGILVVAWSAFAQGPAVAPTPLSPEEALVVYEELVNTHDGEVYTLNIVGFTTEQEAAAAWQTMNQPPALGLTLDKAFKSVTPRPRYMFSLEPALRERVVNLRFGGRTGPVRTRRGWAIAELLETRAVAAPSFKDVQSALPGLVASGTMPTAEQLSTDPILVKRRELNAIQSAEDLAKARAELDLNMPRSSHFTPLMHALLLGRPELVDALLKRGADANRCAHGNCPLRLAIQIGATASVDRLLKAGAHPDGVAPELGMFTTPLATAASNGDRGLARRLIGAGARIDGHVEGQTPLMAAAARADRAMSELLLDSGADPFARRAGIAPSFRLERSVVDMADASGNPQFAAWMRNVLRSHAKRSGAYAWAGAVEQDGIRHPMDGRPVQLRRAPFRIIFRMPADRQAYVSASTSDEAYARFRESTNPSAGFHSRASISAEDDKNRTLVIHAPQVAPKLWGGSQSWWTTENETRFTASSGTPAGREYIRGIEDFVLIDASDQILDVSIGSYREPAIHLIVGTRIPLGWLDDDVFEPSFVELRFR